MTADIFRQIVLGSEHISFTTTKIGSLLDVEDSKDPEGLRVFYYLVQVRVGCVFSEVSALSELVSNTVKVIDWLAKYCIKAAVLGSGSQVLRVRHLPDAFQDQANQLKMGRARWSELIRSE